MSFRHLEASSAFKRLFEHPDAYAMTVADFLAEDPALEALRKRFAAWVAARPGRRASAEAASRHRLGLRVPEKSPMRLRFDGTISEICRFADRVFGLPALAEASKLVEWDESEHQVRGMTLDELLPWLGTWRELRSTVEKLRADTQAESRDQTAGSREQAA